MGRSMLFGEITSYVHTAHSEGEIAVTNPRQPDYTIQNLIDGPGRERNVDFARQC